VVGLCGTAEERRQVPGDRRVGRVGQAELAESRPRAARWQVVGSNERQEPVAQRLDHFLAREVGGEPAANHRAPRGGDRDGHAIPCAIGQQLLLR
jgi:hypothetical protein